MKRNLLILFAVCLGSALGCGTRRPPNTFRQKLVILGFDGLDPRLVQRWISEGKLPNLKQLADRGGGVHSLETTHSPESPTAWASFADYKSTPGTLISSRPVNADSHRRTSTSPRPC